MDQRSRESDDRNLVRHKDDTDPVLRNSQTDDAVQGIHEEIQPEFDLLQILCMRNQ